MRSAESAWLMAIATRSSTASRMGIATRAAGHSGQRNLDLPATRGRRGRRHPQHHSFLPELRQCNKSAHQRGWRCGFEGIPRASRITPTPTVSSSMIFVIHRTTPGRGSSLHDAGREQRLLWERQSRHPRVLLKQLHDQKQYLLPQQSRPLQLGDLAVGVVQCLWVKQSVGKQYRRYRYAIDHEPYSPFQTAT